jgi:hypothetical protein
MSEEGFFRIYAIDLQNARKGLETGLNPCIVPSKGDIMSDALAVAIAALKAEYITQAAALNNTRAQLDVTMRIEQWAGAMTAAAALQSERLQSYSMGGNSYTRRNVPELEATAETLKQTIENALYGGGSRLVDNRGGRDSYAAW